MNEVYQATDIGPVRQVNEDSLAVIEPATYLVADGMGGCAAGEVASSLLVEAARDVLAAEENISEITLKSAILEGNKRILAAATANPAQQGMGTTATLCHLAGGRAYWAHVGDSRLYLYHGGVLAQITRDHSFVADLLDKGEITKEDALTHPQRNMLMRAVGVDEVVAVDCGSFAIAAGDWIVLATDGLTGEASDEEIKRILDDEAQPDKAKALVAAALSSGTRDNVSVLTVKYVG